jgi:signal transduction histidine kinase
VKIAETANNSKKIAQSYIMLSFPEYINGLSDLAQQHIEKAAQISESTGDNLTWLKAKQQLIAIYQSDNHNHNAANELVYVLEKINLLPEDIIRLEDCEDKAKRDSLKVFYIRYIGLTESYAKITLDQGNFDEALNTYNLIMTIIQNSGLDEQRERQYLNLGHAYLRKNNTDSAFSYCRKAIKKAVKDNNIFNMTDAYELLGDIYFDLLSDYPNAITAYNKALYHSKDLKNTKTKTKQSLKAAKAMVLNESLAEAKSLTSQFLSQSDSLEYEDLEILYYIVTQYYAQTGNSDSTKKYFELYAEASDSTSQLHFKSKITDIETLFELKEERNLNKILEQEKLAANREKVIWILGAILLFLIVLLVLWQVRVKSKLMNKLEEFNETLSEKVQEKTVELHEANQELLKLEDAKSYFISIISHELNTPLSGIIGGISFLEASINDSDSKDICDMVKVSANRLRKMADASRLITQIKIDDVQTNFETLPVSLLLDEVKTYYHAQFENIQYQFESEAENTSLYVNQYLIYKTLIVIIDNAIKFTPKGQPVIIRSIKEDNRFVIQVIDSGEGFSEHYLENTYKFFISDEITSHGEGLGLGLSTCKLIMDYHDGEISIENNPDKGATVSLKFALNSENII